MEAQAPPARRLEQDDRSHHVRPEEAGRIDDGVAVVRLGGEVHDRVDLLGVEHLVEAGRVGDVALGEDDPVAEVAQVREVARVGERVVGDDVVVGALGRPVAHEVRADEPGGAGDEEPHRTILRSPRDSTRWKRAERPSRS